MNQNLFNQKHIILDVKVKNQNDAFDKLASLAVKLGLTDDKSSLISGFKAREKESTTGFEDGFAIPHARIPSIKKPGILLMRFSDGIDWKSMDGKPTKVAIALIIPADKASDIHLSILSDVARKLVNSNFRDNLRNETDKSKIVNLLLDTNEKDNSIKNTKSEDQKINSKDTKTLETKLILAMTACPVGVAHTFMAADKLNEVGPKMGYTIKVETHGSDGVKNNFTAEEIEKAEVIISAADIALDFSRFNGKKVYNCSVSRAIKEPEKVINDALQNGEIQNIGEFNTKQNKSSSNSSIGIMQHLMSGVSYMVPIVIMGGIFLAISIGISKAMYGKSFSIDEMSNGAFVHTDNFLFYVNRLGAASFMLMIPILGAFIANSIAGRAAIAPALVVSYIGNTPDDFFPLPGMDKVETPTGFVGAILVGLAVGYTVKWINNWKVPKMLRPVMPIFFIPIVLGFIYGAIMMFVIGSCVGWVMEQFKNWINNTWNGSNATNMAIGFGFGLLIGAMAGFDMGGPINKVAFLACTGLIDNGVYTPMGAMAVAIPVAPLGMGLTTWIFKSLFNEEQRTMGSTAFFMGCIGISEGAIPFAVNDPKRVIVANVVGSCVAGGIAGAVGITDMAAHGGVIIGLLGALGRGTDIGWGTAWLWTLLAFVFMFIGAFITAFIYGFWLISDKRRKGEDISMRQFLIKREKNEGTLAAIKRSKDNQKSLNKNKTTNEK